MKNKNDDLFDIFDIEDVDLKPKNISVEINPTEMLSVDSEVEQGIKHGGESSVSGSDVLNDYDNVDVLNTQNNDNDLNITNDSDDYDDNSYDDNSYDDNSYDDNSYGDRHIEPPYYNHKSSNDNDDSDTSYSNNNNNLDNKSNNINDKGNKSNNINDKGNKNNNINDKDNKNNNINDKNNNIDNKSNNNNKNSNLNRNDSDNKVNDINKNNANGKLDKNNNDKNSRKNNSISRKSEDNKPSDSNKLKHRNNNHKVSKNDGRNTPKKQRINKAARNVNKARDRAAKAMTKAESVAKAGAKAAKKAAQKVTSAMAKFFAWLMAHPLVFGILIAVVVMIFIILIVINVYASVQTPGMGNDVKINMNNFSKDDQEILEKLNNLPGMEKPNSELAIYAALFPYFETLQNGSIDVYMNEDVKLSDTEKSLFNEIIENHKDEIFESFGCNDVCKDIIGDSGADAIIKIYAKEFFKQYAKNSIKEFLGLGNTSDSLPWNSEDSGEQDIDVSDLLDDLGDPYLKVLRKKKFKKKLKKLLRHLSNDVEDGKYNEETDFYDYLQNDYFNEDAGYKALFEQTNDQNGLTTAIIEQLEQGASDYEVYIMENLSSSETDDLYNEGDGYRSCKSYKLTDEQIEKLASIANAEQSGIDGVKAEASLMVNRFELHGGKYSSVYDYVLNSGWFATKSLNSGKPSKKIIDAVKDVIVNGKRTLPSYIDEHDCWDCWGTCKNGNKGDICSIKNSKKEITNMSDITNRKNYKSDVTYIKNNYGGGYTFYSFPTNKSDPFGYTKKFKDECVQEINTNNTNGLFASNNRKKGDDTGQCIVYVEKRAVEIINSAKVGYEGISDRSKYTKVWSSAGFGCAKYALKDGSPKSKTMKKLFKYSTDYKKPQAGAVIVWDGTKNNCNGEPAGHVAVIEKVNDNGTVTISQSNWCSNSCEKFTTNTLKLSEIKNYGGGHPFIGYIYLLQPKK